jgi:hypothetical protein
MPRFGIRVRLLSIPLAALCCAIVTTPASALLINQTVRVNHAREFESLTGDTFNDNEDGPHIEQGGPASARVNLGDGTNAFGEPAFAQAFSAFQNGQPTYWVSLSADNGLVLVDNGNGAADVHFVFDAIKQAGDTAFTMHVTGGLLQVFEDQGKFSPLARVDLHAVVSTDQGVFTDFKAFAQLTGHGGVPALETFHADTAGFHVTPADVIKQETSGTIVGETLQIPAIDIPVDLSNIFDDVPITISVFLTGEVRSPGTETAASAFLRDPAHVNDPDPFAGALTITFEAATPGPGTSLGSAVPEPSSLALIVPGLITAWASRRRQCKPDIQ